MLKKPSVVSLSCRSHGVLFLRLPACYFHDIVYSYRLNGHAAHVEGQLPPSGAANISPVICHRAIVIFKYTCSQRTFQSNLMECIDVFRLLAPPEPFHFKIFQGKEEDVCQKPRCQEHGQDMWRLEMLGWIRTEQI